jgi:hypothetical protein
LFVRQLDLALYPGGCSFTAAVPSTPI